MIETEFKYVLDLDKAKKIRKLVEGASRTKKTMVQRYISTDCRIRQTIEGDTVTHEFNFKKKTKSGVVEIETQIEQRYFDLLAKTQPAFIRKDRFELDHNGLVWEIDFFLDGSGKPYFVMAEVEVAEGESRPKSVPPLLADFVIFDVQYGDKRFSSKNCLSPGVMQDLLKRIKNGKL